MLIIFSELSLRVDVLKEFSSLPPFLISLNQNGFWCDFLNQFLSSLCEHSRLVTSSNEVYFLSIESLGEMDQCGFKAVDSTKTLEIAMLTYLSPFLSFLLPLEF